MNADDFLDAEPEAQGGLSADAFLDDVGAAPAYDPTSEMSGLDRFRAGVGRGMVSLWHGANQLENSAQQGLAGLLLPANHPTLKVLADERAALDSEVGSLETTDAPLMATTGGKAGNIAGQVAASLPLGMALGGGGFLPTVAKGAVVGGGIGALEATTDQEKRKENTLYGALGGAAGGALGKGLEKTVRGFLANSVSPQARTLLDEGIRLTPGQAIKAEGAPMAGRIVRGLEERAKAWPISGPIIKEAEKKGFKDWNQYIAQKVAPEGYRVRTGKEAPLGDKISELSKAYGDKYQSVLGGKFISADQQLLDDFARIETDANSRLGAGAGGREIFKHDLQATLGDVLDKGGYAGDQWKLLDDGLQLAKNKAFRDGNKWLADSYGDAINALKSALYRNLAPEEAATLQSIDSTYGNFLTLQRAATSVAAQKKGLITPDQLVSASKAMDKSPRKSAFARGNAKMQEDALLANDVLGYSIPDVGPGTAEKLMPALMMAGKGALAWYDLGLGATLAGLTSRPAVNAMIGAYPLQAQLGRGARAITPAFSALGAALTQSR